jgi:hypothetical protein
VTIRVLIADDHPLFRYGLRAALADAAGMSVVAATRQIFGILTCYCRSREAYDRECDFMIRHGIPASFLPDPEPGRFASSAGVR